MVFSQRTPLGIQEFKVETVYFSPVIRKILQINASYKIPQSSASFQANSFLFPSKRENPSSVTAVDSPRSRLK